MFGHGGQATQLKSDDLLNQHFPWLIFFEHFAHKNWEVGDELLNYY